jgi:hypothetical protein
MSVIKPLANNTYCNTVPNSFGNNNLVYLTHVANTNEIHTITCKANTGTQLWSIAVCGGESIILQKNPTDTLESGDATNTVRGVQIAYKN